MNKSAWNQQTQPSNQPTNKLVFFLYCIRVRPGVSAFKTLCSWWFVCVWFNNFVLWLLLLLLSFKNGTGGFVCDRPPSVTPSNNCPNQLPLNATNDNIPTALQYSLVSCAPLLQCWSLIIRLKSSCNFYVMFLAVKFSAFVIIFICTYFNFILP